ncbi:MAG: hypothetical protein ABJO27_11405 [Pseudoruegeria sp.]
MFSLPTSFSDFVIKCIKTLPYAIAINGAIAFIIGMFMISSATSFTTRGIEAKLQVTAVESKRSDNGVVYRPIFETTTKDGETQRYTGNTWVSPKPHNEGDVVAGLVDWSSGEMKSLSMIEWSKSFGKTLASIGGLCFVLGGAYIWYKRRKAESSNTL